MKTVSLCSVISTVAQKCSTTITTTLMVMVNEVLIIQIGGLIWLKRS